METYSEIKAVVGFNSRFVQSKPGETNVLSLAKAGVDGKKINV